LRKENQAWIIDDDESIRWVLEESLSQAGLATRSFSRGEDFFKSLKKSTPNVIITDIRMPDISGFDILKKISEDHSNIPVIVITAHSDLDNAVSSYQRGAFEYLPKPFDINDAVSIILRAAKQTPYKVVADDSSIPKMIGKAPAMQEVFRAIGRLSHSSMNVLITGESGTGKELVAKSLHENSPRAREPFIPLNTSAFVADLLESELFGHEKGSFTGAEKLRIGRFEQANGGTLFLDEIGDMSLDLQARLLRVLAESEFFRVGGLKSIKVDVRVIAATNKNLFKLVENGSFREDLYYRLNVMSIEVPSLRDRDEDIASLANYYLKQASHELDISPKLFTEEALSFLETYSWPGNVRELINICRRVAVTAAGQSVLPEAIPLQQSQEPHESNGWSKGLSEWVTSELSRERNKPLLDEVIPIIEQILIKAALKKVGGKKLEAAKLLGWGRNTLTRKIKAMGIKQG